MRTLFLSLLVLCFSVECFAAARIKDVTSVRGIRSNQLVGYGLVTGLKGSGDTLRNSPFTEQSIRSMLERMGVNIRNVGARTRNVAAVTVTAELPPFAKRGGRIDVVVTSIGDATSLAGGVLIMTPLYAGDNKIYAVAQGSLAISGFELQGQSEALTKGVPTTGRIPNGAIIEQSAPGDLSRARQLFLELRNPDFSTSVLVSDAINRFGRDHYGVQLAGEQDSRTIAVKIPKRVSPARFLAQIGQLWIKPDQPARIVIDERTGTIVIGKDVKVSTVAVTHGNLTVRVTETPIVSQPAPFSRGATTVTSETVVEATQEPGSISLLGGADLHTLVRGLNRIGLKPPGIIAILQAIKTTGALQAELVIQ